MFFTHSPTPSGHSDKQETRDDSSDVDQGFDWWRRRKVSTVTFCGSCRTDKGLRISNILMRCTFVQYKWYCCCHFSNVRGGFVFVGVDEVLCTVYGTFVWTENREYPALLCSVITLSLNGIVERQTIRRGRCIRILTGANMARLRDQQCSAKFGRRGKTFSAAKTGSRADRPLYQVYSVL